MVRILRRLSEFLLLKSGKLRETDEVCQTKFWVREKAWDCMMLLYDRGLASVYWQESLQNIF